MAELPAISRDELRQKIERGEKFVLVDALAPMSFAIRTCRARSTSRPSGSTTAAPRESPIGTTEIVVYCASTTCDSSVQVGERLIELGYPNVHHYVEGKPEPPEP